jgi:molybdopterin synthase sulfur carrier subunit
MLTVLFFADIRERLETSELQWRWQPDIDALIASLGERGLLWGEVLRAPNVIVAVNQAVAEPGQALRDGDEVAFFPPVTGG